MNKSSLIAHAHQQLKSAHEADAGRSSKTVYGGHEHVLRQTVIALVAGQALSEHANPGEATVFVLQGCVRLTAGTVTWEGSAGDLLVVPDRPHSLQAVDDAVVLLTVAKRSD